MSIDTALKRASAANDQFVQFLPPEPSGSIGAAERAIVVWAYAGLDYEAPVEPDADPAVDSGQYARFGIEDSTYPRQSDSDTTYPRSAG